jgi:citrate lyase subunit beta/citryl-CoA lyase
MRSLLFVPADSPRKFERASQSNADTLILDLEDSVAPERKQIARETTRQSLQQPRGRQKLFVRINALDTGESLADLAAVMPAGPDGIVLPKCSGASQVRQLAHYLDAFEAASNLSPGMTRIIAIATETAQSIFGLREYGGCSDRLWGLMWGGEDLATSLGAMQNQVDGAYLGPYRLARDLCLMGAAAAGVAAIDTVFVDIGNLSALEKESLDARRDGFVAKAIIHPKHVDIVNAAFSPAKAELEWAHRIVEAFAANPGAGVVKLDGHMVDKPHLERAKLILASSTG